MLCVSVCQLARAFAGDVKERQRTKLDIYTKKCCFILNTNIFDEPRVMIVW
jgi:hypothetical protein